MVYIPELRDRMKLLLTEIICQICTKEVPHKYQIHIEGTICITSDTHPAFAIQIAQLLSKAADLPNLRTMPKSVYQPAVGYGGPTTPTENNSFGQGGSSSAGGGGGVLNTGPGSEGSVANDSPSHAVKSGFPSAQETRSGVPLKEGNQGHTALTVTSRGDSRDMGKKRSLLKRHHSDISESCRPVDMRGPSAGSETDLRIGDGPQNCSDLKPLSSTCRRKLSAIDDPEEIVRNVERNAKLVIRKVSVTECRGDGQTGSPTGALLHEALTSPRSLTDNLTSGEFYGTDTYPEHTPLRKRGKFEYCREFRMPRQLSVDSRLSTEQSSPTYVYSAKPSEKANNPTDGMNEHTSNLKPLDAADGCSETSDPGQSDPPVCSSSDLSVSKHDDILTQQGSMETISSKGTSKDDGDKDTGSESKGKFTVKDMVRNMIFQREKSVERSRTSSMSSLSNSVIRDMLQSTCSPSTIGTNIVIPSYSSVRVPNVHGGIMRQSSLDGNTASPRPELHVDTTLAQGHCSSVPLQSLSGLPSFRMEDDKMQSPTYRTLQAPTLKSSQSGCSSFPNYMPSVVSPGTLPIVKPIFASGNSSPVIGLDYSMHPNVQQPTLLPLTKSEPTEGKDDVIGEPKVRTPSGHVLPGSPGPNVPADAHGSGDCVVYKSIPCSSVKHLSSSSLNLKQEPGLAVSSSTSSSSTSSDPNHSPSDVVDVIKDMVAKESSKQLNLGHLSKETINGLIIIDHETQKCISPQDYVYKDAAGETQVRACEYCGKHFKYFSKLMEHIRSHTKQKPYKCSICGRTYTYKGDLTVHIRQHSTSKPYVCDCGRSFASKKYLSVHQSQARIKGRHAISKDERPAHYECLQCGKIFKFFTSYALHLPTHQASGSSGGNPVEMFECQSCNRLFKDHSLFVEHVLEHENGEHDHTRIKCEVEDDEYDDDAEHDLQGNSSIEEKDNNVDGDYGNEQYPERDRGDSSSKGQCQHYHVIQTSDAVVRERLESGTRSPELSDFCPLVMGKVTEPVPAEGSADRSPEVQRIIESTHKGNMDQDTSPTPKPVSKPDHPTTVIDSSTSNFRALPKMSSEHLHAVYSTPQMVLPGTHILPQRHSDLSGVPTAIQIPVTKPFTLGSIPHTLTSGTSCQPFHASTISQLTSLSGQPLQLHAVQPHVQVLSVQPLLHSPVQPIPMSIPLSLATSVMTPTITSIPANFSPTVSTPSRISDQSSTPHSSAPEKSTLDHDASQNKTASVSEPSTSVP